MSRRSPTRRSFLRAVGSAFAAIPASVPVYRLLEDHVAKAYGETLPLRFVGIYHPHGVAAEHFVMRSTDTTTNFDLKFANSSLSPFDDAATYGKSWKSKIVVIEGIDHLSNANGHDSAATILTGSRVDSSAKVPLNSSLDQFLAVEKKLGASTPVTSIQLGVGNVDTASGSTLSYGQGGVALPKIIDPAQAYKTLFGTFTNSSDPAASAEATRNKKMGQSLVSFLSGDVSALQGRLAAPEKAILQAHLDALNDFGKQFNSTSTGGGTGGGSCKPADKPDATKFPKLQAYNGGEPYFDAITNAHLTLLAHAFACDVTRFATLYMADLSYAGNPLNLPADNHGGMAHTYDASPVGADGHPGGSGNPTTWVPLASFNRYCYGKVASLMQQLDALGVLDNTLIYATSDMGNPALHSTRNVPTLLAGGANGKIQMGRRLKMVDDCPTSDPWCAPGAANFKGVTNNHLLVSIAQAFGVSVNTFGSQPNSADTTGALPML